MDSVVVLMSTYNGERFLEEQIESILKQKDVDVVLYVRDDGSSDRTKQILDEYQRKNAQMLVSYEKNEGVGNSFMDLVYMAPETSDYYAFADQDDIWRDTKLIEAIKLLKQSGKNLYVSNQDEIIIQGEYAESEGYFQDNLRKTIQLLSLHNIQNEVKLTFSFSGRGSTPEFCLPYAMMGASLFCFDRYFSQLDFHL